MKRVLQATLFDVTVSQTYLSSTGRAPHSKARLSLHTIPLRQTTYQPYFQLQDYSAFLLINSGNQLRIEKI